MPEVDISIVELNYKYIISADVTLSLNGLS